MAGMPATLNLDLLLSLRCLGMDFYTWVSIAGNTLVTGTLRQGFCGPCQAGKIASGKRRYIVLQDDDDGYVNGVKPVRSIIISKGPLSFRRSTTELQAVKR